MPVPAHREPDGPTFPTPEAMRAAVSFVDGLAARGADQGRQGPVLATLRHALSAGQRELSSSGLRAKLCRALDLVPGAGDEAIVAAVRNAVAPHTRDSHDELVIDGDMIEFPHRHASAGIPAASQRATSGKLASPHTSGTELSPQSTRPRYSVFPLEVGVRYYGRELRDAPLGTRARVIVPAGAPIPTPFVRCLHDGVPEWLPFMAESGTYEITAVPDA